MAKSVEDVDHPAMPMLRHPSWQGRWDMADTAETGEGQRGRDREQEQEGQSCPGKEGGRGGKQAGTTHGSIGQYREGP